MIVQDADPYVLMVEDNEDDVALTLRSLERNQFVYKIVVAHDGAEALKHLSENGRHLPVLILLDLNLPKVSGLEVLKQVRAATLLKNIPVLILSSSDGERDRAAALSLGANLYIRKPINFNDFDAVAEQIQNFLPAAEKMGP